MMNVMNLRMLILFQSDSTFGVCRPFLGGGILVEVWIFKYIMLSSSYSKLMKCGSGRSILLCKPNLKKLRKVGCKE